MPSKQTYKLNILTDLLITFFIDLCPEDMLGNLAVENREIPGGMDNWETKSLVKTKLIKV